MPEFSTINHVYSPSRKLTDVELLRAIKFAIASEFEAIQIYQQIAVNTDNMDAKRVLADIAEEEKQHVGELDELYRILSPEDVDKYAEGANEVTDILEK